MNAQLCVDLPADELKSLVTHELYHHVGVSHVLHSLPAPRDTNARHAYQQAMNLSFDVVLEQAMLRNVEYAAALDRLNHRLLTYPAGDDMLSPAVAAIALVHEAAPLHRLPAVARQAWTLLWEPFQSDSVCLSPLEAYQTIAPLIADGAIAPAEAGPRIENYVNEFGELEQLAPRQVQLDHSPSPLCAALPQAIDFAYAGGGSDFSPRAVQASHAPATRVVELRRWIARQLAPACRKTGAKVVRRPYLVRPTTSELFRRASGWPATHFSNRGPALQRTTFVYLDISASMYHRIPVVLAVMQQLEKELPTAIFLFDTQVCEITRAQLLSGSLVGGSGTDFDCVVRHALERKARAILVFTDGESTVSPLLLAEAQAARLTVFAVVFSSCQLPPQPWWHSVFAFDPHE